MAGRASLRRYSRHLLIPEVGLAGQERLSRGRVLVVGAGGLGSPVLAYLAAAGVGRILVIDDDTVDVTNLQRQILYDTSDVGASKAQRASERLRALNPQIAVDALPVRFDASNARELVRLVDVVVDGSDTFATRYLVNDACAARSFASTVKSRSLVRRAVRVIAASIRRRRPSISCRRAARAACWASWPEWSVRFRPTKRSNCCWGSGRR
jgi:molybdopterin/thiamine biosynthesis adenylyltransferase